MKTYMVTMPRKDDDTWHPVVRLLNYIREHDIKKWVIAMETGRGGYKHWQIRLDAREDFWKFEEREEPRLGPNWTIVYEKVKKGVGWANINMPGAHVEEASDSWEYETKEGAYWASWDTPEVRRMRFGKMRWAQKVAVETLRATNDREVMVWVDVMGNCGKSWLVGHLYETGQAYYLPPTMTSVQAMLQTMASLAWADREKGRPPRPFVLIDIPRSWKWSKDLYCAVETIKDGLIMDPRYSARPINIRGVKVLVMTNISPKVDALSKDRWKEYNAPMF